MANEGDQAMADLEKSFFAQVESAKQCVDARQREAASSSAPMSLSNEDDPAIAELEQSFFAQVRAAKLSVDEKHRQSESSESILDTALGGVDVDSLLSSVMSRAEGGCEGLKDTESQASAGKDTGGGETQSSDCSSVAAGSRSNTSTGWVVAVASRDAKPVKDELRDQGWLDRKVKVTKETGPEGEMCSFRLVSSCDLERVSAAINSGGVFAGSTLRQIQVAPPAAVDKQTRGDQAAKSAKKQTAKKANAVQPAWQATELPGGEEAQRGLDYIRLFGSARTAAGPPPPPLAPPSSSRAGSEIPRVGFVSSEQVQQLVSVGQPFVLTGLDLGPCVGLWDAKYLAEKASERLMSAGVHVCPRKTVDLAGHRLPNTPKNFEFVQMPFAEFVQRCAPQSFPDRRDLAPVLQEGERLYLRSVAEGPEAQKKASHLADVFPEIAGDIKLPAGRVYAQESYFSSVLRIASGDTQLWTHYDTMHNILIQVTGRKHAVLWPPSEHDSLYTEGSSSRVPDIDSPDLRQFPDFNHTWSSRLECDLVPGDALFIPGLWFHHVTMLDFSVAVNVFWRDLAPDQYSRKDLYGNRDLIVAQQAVNAAVKAAGILAHLPQPYRSFYAKRAARALEAAAVDGCEEEGKAASAEAAAAVSRPVMRGAARTCVVTGAARGIGLAVALGLARAGAQVIMCCRDVARGAVQAAAVRGLSGNDKVWVEAVDLSSGSSICALARRVGERYGAVHVLVNNAVVAPADKEQTQEGLEAQFAVNVLGYHRMIDAFLPLLMDGAPARVINMSSQYAGKLDMDDLMFVRRPYHAAQAYMQSKQANRMMTWAWAEQLPASQVMMNACHPGSVAGTQLASALGLKSGSHTSEAAAASVLSLALDERWSECSGLFVVCGEALECPWQGDPQCKPLLDLLRSLSPPQ